MVNFKVKNKKMALQKAPQSIILLALICLLGVFLTGFVSAGLGNGLVSVLNMSSNLNAINNSLPLIVADGQVTFNGTIFMKNMSADFSNTKSMYVDNSNTSLDWNFENPAGNTLSFWINTRTPTPSIGDVAIWYKRTPGMGPYMRITAGTNLAEVNSLGGGPFGDLTPIVNDTWYNYVILVNTTSSCLFRDAVLQQCQPAFGVQHGAIDFAWGGGAPDFANFIGVIDEVYLWNRGLNQSEITDLYNSGAGNLYPFTAVTSVTLNSPPNYYNSTSADVNFNCSANTDGDVVLTNMTLWIDGGVIETKIKTGIANESIFNGTFLSGLHNWTCQACSNNSVCSFAGLRFFNSSLITEIAQSYNATTYVTAREGFNINLTYDNLFYSISAKLNYNGILYTGTKTGTGNNALFNAIVNIPNANGTYPFYWNVSLTSLSSGSIDYYKSLNYTQAVGNVGHLNATTSSCSAGYSPAFYFNFAYEPNLTTSTATGTYNLKYGLLGNTSAFNLYGSFTSANNLSICVNNSDPYFSVSYGEIQYTVPITQPRRFYIFSNTRFTNATINNTLYGLDITLATAFQITATNTNLEPYDNNYIGLLRWYPDLNQYKIVDMGKTDQFGQTVLYVKTNDVDYRLALYELDGTLIKLLDPIRMVCQTNPCVYNLIVNPVGLDLTGFLDIQGELTWNPTTKVFTYIWNDPSQDTTLMNLSVYQETGTDSFLICSSSGTSFTGILVCDVSAYTGNFKAVVYRSASPAIIIASLWASIKNTFITAGGGTMGLIIGLLLVITFALMGIFSPVIVIILGVVALIPLLLLGAISLTIFTIIGVIAGIVIHFLGRIT